MSFAGHVSDMISRIKNNREWHLARKARQKKILEAYRVHKHHDDDINPENSNELDGLENMQEDDFVEEKLENYKFPPLDLLENSTKEEAETISDEELKHL